MVLGVSSVDGSVVSIVVVGAGTVVAWRFDGAIVAAWGVVRSIVERAEDVSRVVGELDAVFAVDVCNVCVPSELCMGFAGAGADSLVIAAAVTMPANARRISVTAAASCSGVTRRRGAVVSMTRVTSVSIPADALGGARKPRSAAPSRGRDSGAFASAARASVANSAGMSRRTDAASGG